jgi:hypothetical protein
MRSAAGSPSAEQENNARVASALSKAALAEAEVRAVKAEAEARVAKAEADAGSRAVKAEAEARVAKVEADAGARAVKAEADAGARAVKAEAGARVSKAEAEARVSKAEATARVAQMAQQLEHERLLRQARACGLWHAGHAEALTFCGAGRTRATGDRRAHAARRRAVQGPWPQGRATPARRRRCAIPCRAF